MVVSLHMVGNVAVRRLQLLPQLGMECCKLRWTCMKQSPGVSDLMHLQIVSNSPAAISVPFEERLQRGRAGLVLRNSQAWESRAGDIRNTLWKLAYSAGQKGSAEAPSHHGRSNALGLRSVVEHPPAHLLLVTLCSPGADAYVWADP